jgi:hypothetical protein
MSVRMLKDEVISLKNDLLSESTSTFNSISTDNNDNSGNISN